MLQFSITYEVVTPESADEGDVADRGFVAEYLSLRDAVELLGVPSAGYEPDSMPLSRCNPPRWITAYDIDHDYRTGARESRSIHFPREISPSSAMRIARLFGIQ